MVRPGVETLTGTNRGPGRSRNNIPALLARLLIMGRGRRAFTLVEILVVVAIIIVVGGILLVTVVRTKDRGKVAVCLSNLRQLDHAMTLYTMDNDDRTFPGLPASTAFLAAWKKAMRSYVSSDDIYYCPADKYARVGTKRQIQARYSSYEQWLGPGAVWQDGIYHYYVPGIPDPEKNQNLSEWWTQASDDEAKAGQYSATPHDVTYSVLYWDGHVKHLRNPWVMNDRPR